MNYFALPKDGIIMPMDYSSFANLTRVMLNHAAFLLYRQPGT
jgi:hypothetical protein